MIRKAIPSDFSFVYEMYMHPIINPHLLYEMMREEDFIPIYDKLIANGIMYIFHDEQNRIGMFKLIPNVYRAAHIVYLGSVAVHPNFASKGYGIKMMQEIIEFSKTNQYKRIELSAGVKNEKAIALYKKVGFDEEGVLKKYTYLKSEDRYIDEMMMGYIIH
jgi:L-phenylalanine/L-methionine N-acetyltransferase